MKSALLVIDVQRVLFESNPPPFAVDSVISNINLLAEQARSLGVPVIFIQHEQEDSIITYGSEGWQLQSDLVVHDTDVLVRKTTPDSFLRTELDSILKSYSITDLVICGYATEFCVDTTVRRAAALGYSIQLVADAHTTHDKEHATAEKIRLHHNKTLSNIKSFGVSIASIKTDNIKYNIIKCCTLKS
ncbi:cysteine hydrolase family protein [Spartinivicinus ruber]|uniref:cysteine hydrolase family protein n=1 Tax=Spartinivicinus ruber TaxID=2683272 RepID=UPI0013CFEC5E|nr:cysteine hydrolase family protein [Spartinivicinus ruber]